MDINKICPGCMAKLEGIEGMNVCPYCGYRLKDAETEPYQLRPRTVLAGKYLVGKVIGEGGFGITYIGYDMILEMPLAIKEFYPNGFVTRETCATSKVTIHSSKSEGDVGKWRDSFLNEARNLAKFSSLGGIVEVRDFFTENNTAYIVMEYVDGITLKNYLNQNGGKIPVNVAFAMMEPVIHSLTKVHETGMIHRDISPDNIMITKDGRMKLLDFGAAREYAANSEKSLSIMLKPGYAPEEQYRSRGKQGPWTDVYALCATIYKCITGITPVESMERMRGDTLQRPSALGVYIPQEQENALMRGMAVYAENRIQSMGELYTLLYGGGTATQPMANAQMQTQAQSAKRPSVSKKKKLPVIIAAVAGVIVICELVVCAVVFWGNNKGSSSSRREEAAEALADVDIDEEASKTETSDQADNGAALDEAELAELVKEVEGGISSYDDENELAAALDAYEVLAEQYGNTGDIGNNVYRLFNAYGEIIAERVERLNGYDPSVAYYTQMQTDLDKSLGYAEFFAEYNIGVQSDKLEELRADINSRYKARFVKYFDTCAEEEISEGGKLSGDELWRIMEGVDEIDLYTNEDDGIDFDSDPPIAPIDFDLHARYELAYALYIDSQNEYKGTEKAIEAIYDFLENSTYFCPYLIYKLEEYGDSSAHRWMESIGDKDHDFYYMSEIDKLNHMYDYYIDVSYDDVRLTFSTYMTDVLLNGAAG